MVNFIHPIAHFALSSNIWQGLWFMVETRPMMSISVSS